MANPPLLRAVSVAVLAFLLACGEDEHTPPPSGSAGAGADGGSGGGPGGGGTAGEGGTGASAGSGGAGGSGGGGAGGGPSVERAPQCDPLEAHLTGEIGGRAIDAPFAASGVTAVGGAEISFGEWGALYLLGPGALPSGDPEAVTAVLRMPDDSSDPGAWYCGGEGTAVQLGTRDLEPLAVLQDLSSLGACPGEPVAGEVDLCFLDETCGAPGMASALDGATFEVPIDGFIGVGSDIDGPEAEISTTLLGGGGFVRLQATGVDPAAPEGVPQTSPLGIGWFLVPAGQPDAGAIYCIGAGSTFAYRNEAGFVTPLSAKLNGVTRVGACPGDHVRGELGFCMNMDRAD
ncbi:MAG: hypothetical protein WKG00_40205 [Polyangiaceae bacterium]